jgi:hypothetical protein
MSQFFINAAAGPPPTPSVLTLSDVTGTKVSPDSSGNIELEGRLNEQVGSFQTVTAVPGSHEFLINPMSGARWIVDPLSTALFPNGTSTTIAASNALASSGDTILIMPGVYTENITAKAGVNYVGMGGDQANPNVTIIGETTANFSGTCTFANVRLQTNGSFLLLTSGANATIVEMHHCFLNCTNSTGISFTNSNAASNVNLRYCEGNLATTGIAYFASSSPGTIQSFYGSFGNTGGSTTANTISAGFLGLQYSDFANPVTLSGTSQLLGSYSVVNTNAQNVTALTVGGSGGGTFSYGALAAGSASALSVGSSFIFSSSAVTSSNTNAITGAGTLSYDIIQFPGSSSTINATLTLSQHAVAPGIVYAGNGSNLLPAYSFNSSPSTGMYYDTGTNTLRFAVAGGEDIRMGAGFINILVPTNLTAVGLGGNFQTTTGPTFSPNATNTIIIACDPSSNAITIDMPTGGSLSSGQLFVIKDYTGHAATHSITITTTGGTVTFDGATSLTITNNFGCYQLFYNPVTSNYAVLSKF